jgi:glycosyltransferase involved in cell wall biosynthesis
MIDSTENESAVFDDKIPVSVIVPCFNNQAFLRDCIGSINSASRPDEIIVIDDKSTDGSLAVAHELASEYPNVRICQRTRNGGAAAAREEGIRAARNDWVALVDADDFVEENAVSAAFQNLRLGQADICIWDMWRFDGKNAWPHILLNAKDFPKTGRQAVVDTLGQWKIHPLGVARKEIYLSAYDQFSEATINADELLTRIAFARSNKVVFCKKKYYYRANMNSTTRTISSKSLTSLRSHIWLLNFAKSYPEVKPELLGTGAITQAWYFYRKRDLVGTELVTSALIEFLREFDLSCQPFQWLWRYPKHFFIYLALLLVVGKKRTGPYQEG